MKRENWARVHSHIHTVHSDGHSTLLDMAEAHKKSGFDAFYVTDHNTTSAKCEIDQVEKETGIAILPGVEYTTAYGHILSYGDYLADWTKLTPESMAEFLDEIKSQGALTGMAHYHCIGYPLCTGCRFEFDGLGTDYDLLKPFDMMEVCHGDRYNWENNHKLWIELLNRGNRITALSGLDAHRKDQVLTNPMGNFVRIDQQLPLKEAITGSMKKGDLSMSSGDVVDFSLSAGDTTYTMGDIIEHRLIDSTLSLNVSLLLKPLDFEFDQSGPFTIRVLSNLGILKSHTFLNEKTGPGGAYHWQDLISADPELKWVHVELSEEDYFTRQIRALTNSVYFK